LRWGDVLVARVLWAYVVGKPAEAANPDHLDLDKFHLLVPAPGRRDAAAARDCVGPGYAAQQTREGRSGGRRECGWVRRRLMRKTAEADRAHAIAAPMDDRMSQPLATEEAVALAQCGEDDAKD
jgi:hypothetical protein